MWISVRRGRWKRQRPILVGDENRQGSARRALLLWRGHVVGYAKSLVYFVVPWVFYVLAVSLLCDRLGIWLALGTGIAAYLALSWTVMQFR